MSFVCDNNNLLTKSEDALCRNGYRCLRDGDYEQAVYLFKQALAVQTDCLQAHLGLARASLSGPGYIEIIEKLIAWLEPKNFVEIGVDKGAVLKLFQPPVKVIGIDPRPEVQDLPATTAVYPCKSDDFFTRNDLNHILGGPLDLAFIDGLHLFEQVLRDFMHLEKYSGPDTIVLIHDCLPLDRLTAERKRQTIFWSGDVWKIIPCLKNERPELTLFTLPAYPTGLCVVTGLRPGSRILWEKYDEVVLKYQKLDYNDIGARREYFSLLSNEWPVIKQALVKG
jgi:hypothetical protein